MSQIIKDLSAGPVPPSVATTYQTNSGDAVPDLNVLIVHGTSSIEENPLGITVKGGAVVGVSNEIDIVLTNRFHSSGTTIGATTADLITFGLSGTPANFFFNFSTSAFNASTPAGASYETFSTVGTDGVTATVIGDTDSIAHVQAALAGSSAEVIASGNNAIFRVTGVAGLTINWVVVGTYVKAI